MGDCSYRCMDSSRNNSPDDLDARAVLTGVSNQADQTRRHNKDLYIYGLSNDEIQDRNKSYFMNKTGYQNINVKPTPAIIAEDCLTVPSTFDPFEDISEGNDDQFCKFDLYSSNNNRIVPIAEQVESQNGQEAYWEKTIDEVTVAADESNGAVDLSRQNGTLIIPTMKINDDGTFIPSQVTIEQPVQWDDHSKDSGHLDEELKSINEKIGLNLSSRQECAENLKIFCSKLLNQNRYEFTFEKEKGNRGRRKLYPEPNKTAKPTDIKYQSKQEREAINQRNKKDRSDSATAENLKAKNEAFAAYNFEHNGACEFLRHHPENHGEFCIYCELKSIIYQVELFVNSMPTVDVKQVWTQNKTTQKRMDEGLESYKTKEARNSATHRCRCVLYDKNLVELASFYKTLKNYLISWKELAWLCFYDEEEYLEPGAKRRRTDSEPPLPTLNRLEVSQNDLQQEEMVEKIFSGELDCTAYDFF